LLLVLELYPDLISIGTDEVTDETAEVPILPLIQISSANCSLQSYSVSHLVICTIMLNTSQCKHSGGTWR